jgi:hypothetical protein
MDQEGAPEGLREQADRRFAEALARTGSPDPRELYREWLKELRVRDEGAFRKALEYFEQELVPAVARPDSDPLDEWTEYGLRLAQRLTPGEAVRIDATGRSRPLDGPAPLEEMVLHLPRSARDRALAVRLPPTPSPAQQAAYELLVDQAVE